MKAKLTTMLAFAAATTMPPNESTYPQQGLPRLDNRALSREVAGAIASIAAQTGGNLLLVECTGAFGHKTIQSAIGAAEDGDVVVVLPRNAFGFECEGDAYVENINFLGEAITVQSLIPSNPDYVESTIIDGSSAADEDEQGCVVAFNHNESADSVLNGLTLTAGFGFSSPPHGYRAGGGIYCLAASPTIRNSTITGNTAEFFGGGIYCRSGSSPIIENCRISSNTAGNRGGGIYCFSNSAPTIRGCIITDNTAFFNGGGIHLESWCHAKIGNCTIFGNTCGSFGGGLYSQLSNPLVDNSILWHNRAELGTEIANWLNSTVTVAYSDVEGGEGAVSVGSDSTLHWGCGNIDLDPGFVDPTFGDYHITMLSLARNAGDPDFVWQEHETDIDGDERVQEGRVDMGADEFVLGGTGLITLLGEPAHIRR